MEINKSLVESFYPYKNATVSLYVAFLVCHTSVKISSLRKVSFVAVRTYGDRVWVFFLQHCSAAVKAF